MSGRTPLLAAAAACLCVAAERPSLGLVTEFPADVSSAVQDEFRRETGRVLAGAGVELAWRTLNQTGSHESFNLVVVVQFRGNCTPGRARAPRQDQALGMTFVTDGHVLPFVELDCGHVQEGTETAECHARSLRCAVQLGRALARVAAHEIYHVLTASGTHQKRGLMKPSFDRNDLCGPELTFSPESMRRLRRSLGTDGAGTSAYSRSF